MEIVSKLQLALNSFESKFSTIDSLQRADILFQQNFHRM